MASSFLNNVVGNVTTGKYRQKISTLFPIPLSNFIMVFDDLVDNEIKENKDIIRIMQL